MNKLLSLCFIIILSTSSAALSQGNTHNNISPDIAEQQPMYVTDEIRDIHLGRMRQAMERLGNIISSLSEEDYETALSYFNSNKKHGHGKGNKVPFCLQATENAPLMQKEVQNNMRELKKKLEEKDLKSSLAAVGATMNACSACHSTFKHKIISKEEWEERRKLLNFK